jgi:hypothetical protein
MVPKVRVYTFGAMKQEPRRWELLQIAEFSELREPLLCVDETRVNRLDVCATQV